MPPSKFTDSRFEESQTGQETTSNPLPSNGVPICMSSTGSHPDSSIKSNLGIAEQFPGMSRVMGDPLFGNSLDDARPFHAPAAGIGA
jgi:hypothetical protein